MWFYPLPTFGAASSKQAVHVNALHGKSLSVFSWLDHTPSPAPALAIHIHRILFFRDSLMKSLTPFSPAYGIFLFQEVLCLSIFRYIKNTFNFYLRWQRQRGNYDSSLHSSFLSTSQPLTATLDGNAMSS